MCSRQRTCQKKRSTWQTVWNTNFTWKGSSQFPEISQLFWHGICSALEYGQEIARIDISPFETSINHSEIGDINAPTSPTNCTTTSTWYRFHPFPSTMCWFSKWIHGSTTPLGARRRRSNSACSCRSEPTGALAKWGRATDLGDFETPVRAK